MSNEIELISDGDGLAVIGDPVAVDLFLSSHHLSSRDLGLPRLGQVLSAASGAAHTGSALVGERRSMGAADQGVSMRSCRRSL